LKSSDITIATPSVIGIRRIRNRLLQSRQQSAIERSIVAFGQQYLSQLRNVNRLTPYDHDSNFIATPYQ
jgi:hypothetical protein